MVNILGNLNRALLLGGTLLVLVIAILNGGDIMTNGNWLNAFLRFVHAVVGVLWIGLLYYFNFVQIPTMPKVPAELKPAVGKYIAPEALFWFRWSALATLVIGALGSFFTQRIIMAANVWMFIWPAQKIALGIVDGTPDEKAAAAKKAMLFSRTNFVLSFPMLYCMVTRGVLG